MCKSSVHNYLKKDFGYKAYKKEMPATSNKKQPKIDFDLQRNTKICLKKNGKTICLVTNHQCICFMNKIVKSIAWGSQADKVPVAKRLKRARR